MAHSHSESKRGRRSRRSDSTGFRGQRLTELIREEMNFLLCSEINDPNLEGVRITTVTLSPDGGSVRLYFTVERNDPPTNPERVLRRATGFFRRALCDALSLKRTPELRFALDPARWRALPDWFKERHDPQAPVLLETR